MLDLQPRVHLEEVEPAVFVEHELGGAGVRVADAARGVRPRPRPCARAAPGRARRWALPRSPSDGGAGSSTRARPGARSCRARRRGSGTRCGAAGADSVRAAPLSSPNAALRLALARCASASSKRARSSTTRIPRPPPPALALISSGVPIARRLGAQALVALIVAVVARHDRHAELAHAPLRVDLRAHRRDRVGRRADEDQPGVDDQPRERRALAQEAVAGMDRVGAERLRRRDDPLAVEIRLARRSRPDAQRRVHRRRETARARRRRSRRRPARCPARARRARCGSRSRRGWRSAARRIIARSSSPARRSRNARSPSWPSARRALAWRSRAR